jgi:hypothetical protein
MNKISLTLIILITVSCSWGQNKKMKELVTITNEVQLITQKDDGKFWKTPYKTPTLFVNPENRQAFVFDIGEDPYITQLDNNIPIANTAIKWNDKMWAMVRIPLPENPFNYEKLILHEMFHVLQPELGFGSIPEMLCTHLEQKDARILLRLELNALEQALATGISYNSKDTVLHHLTSALTFRNSRYALYPEAKEKENYLELNEGIAEYTALMMVENYSKNKLGEHEIIFYFNNRISDFLEYETYIRSFAYETIPLYGYIIQKYYQHNWHQTIDINTNLTDYFTKIADVRCYENWEDLVPYYDIGYETVVITENKRTDQMAGIEKAVIEKFQGLNHVKIPLIQFNITYDPLSMMSIESVGELHVTATIIDVWGKLEVSKGMILARGESKAFLSPIVGIDGNTITGDGWTLTLNDGWEIKQTKEWTEIVKK